MPCWHSQQERRSDGRRQRLAAVRKDSRRRETAMPPGLPTTTGETDSKARLTNGDGTAQP